MPKEKKKKNQPNKNTHTHRQKRREQGRDDWHPPQHLMQDCEREKPHTHTHTLFSLSLARSSSLREEDCSPSSFLLLNCLNSLSLLLTPICFFPLHLR
jgi:hypothetical protein